MAAEPSCSFSKSIEKFRARLSDKQREDFSSCSLQDVERSIQEVQDRLGPEKRLRSFVRIRKFLEGMKQIEELVTVFLNVHEVVAFVWGPIKLALLVAATRIDTIDLLLGVYGDIGDVIQGLGKYDRLFRNHEDVRHVLEIYFYDILEFHHCVLDVFARPVLVRIKNVAAWKRVFDSAWPMFRTRFKPIIESLKRHRALLADEKVTAVIEEVQESRIFTEGKLDELSEDLRQGLKDLKQAVDKENVELHDSVLKQKSALVGRFEPPGYEADQQAVASQRLSPHSGDWVLSKPAFDSWVNAHMLPHNILYLSGGPGSGKTTLVSRIINHMRAQQLLLNGSVVFFYFKHREASKTSMVAMLRAIIVQLLYQDDTVLEFLHQKCASMNNAELLRLPFLQDLTKDCLAMQRKVWIILDGLDEAEDQHGGNHEASKVIEWFQKSIILGSVFRENQVRLLVAGQRDGHIDRLLSPCPEIRLERMSPHFDDIENYSSLRAASIRDRFSLELAEERNIIKMVTDTSKGMFLYAKVVLDNLFAQDSPAEFEEEMASDNFPTDLGKAYERVVIRILEKPPIPRRKSAATILGWVLCAARPLRWREIQSRFCIDVDNGYCNFKNRRIDSCKVLCGSLIEEDACERYKDTPSERVIGLVHETAGKYLIHTGRVNLLEEHARTALFCCRYLTSHPFMSSLQDEDAQRLASSGYYGFQDYAVEYGHYHTELSATKAFHLSKQLRVDICNSIICFLEYYGAQQAEDAEKLDRFHEEIPDLQELMSKWRAGRAETLSILESRTASIRQTIESLGAESENNPDKRPYLELEGMLRFKCPKIHCHTFAVGFEKQDERDDHVKEHERPFKCHEQDCYGRIIGFSSHAHLEAHRLRYHTDNIPLGPVFAVHQLKGAPKFYSACSSGNLEAVKISMSSTADLKGSQLSHGLAYAVRKGHIHVCKYLIESGIAVNVIAQKSSPITEAIRKRDWDLALWLWHTAGLPLDELTSPSPYFYTCIAQAIQSGACDILDYLLLGKSISDLRKYVKPVLKEIVFSTIINDMGSQPTKEHTSLMHSWFKRAYPVLYTTDTPTSLLCCQPKYQQAEHQELDDDKWHSVLIDQRMSSLGNTPLHLASLFRNIAPVNFLLDLLGPNDLQITNKDGETPLQTLIVSSKATDGPAKADIARRIIQIDGGTSANTNNNDGDIPLLAVCKRKDCEDVFDVLVDSTLDLNVRNKFDHSALELAVIHDIPEYVTKLLATGRVDVWRRNKSGQTVFSLAAQHYATKRNILELLYAADPSLAVRADTSPQRRTPLHHVLMHAPQSLLGLEPEQAEKAKYLLSLPEVDTLLLEYFNADVPDKLEQWDRLYQFASLHGLVDALAALTMYKAGMIAV